MPAANIMYFDVDSPDRKQGVVYAIDDGGYLYTAILEPRVEDMRWIRGKARIPATAATPTPLSVLGVMRVHKQVVYLVNDATGDGTFQLYVSRDRGESWQSSAVPPPGGGEEYDQAMYVGDAFMLLSGSGEPGVLMKSLDIGAHWHPIFQQPRGIRTIYCDANFVAVGGYGEVSVATRVGMDQPLNWTTYSSANQPGNLLDEQVSKVFCDTRPWADAPHGVIYVVQESAVAHGIVHLGNRAGIQWNNPFTNIKDYKPDATGFFVFGDTIMETVTTGDHSADGVGKYTNYRLNAEPSSPGYINEVGRWSNPYADFSPTPWAGATLRIFNPSAGAGAYRLYLSDNRTFSMSSNGGKDWQQIIVNV